MLLDTVSVLYREPKLLKGLFVSGSTADYPFVSVLYREPKLLKALESLRERLFGRSFSALP